MDKSTEVNSVIIESAKMPRRLCIFASIFASIISLAATDANAKSLDTYIEFRQKLIAEENDNFLGLHSVEFYLTIF